MTTTSLPTVNLTLTNSMTVQTCTVSGANLNQYKKEKFTMKKETKLEVLDYLCDVLLDLQSDIRKYPDMWYDPKEAFEYSKLFRALITSIQIAVKDDGA